MHEIRNILHGAAEFLWGRLVLGIVAVIILLGMAWLLRTPILRSVGSFLVTADVPVSSDALYVLGGAPVDRGMEAAQFTFQGFTRVVVCTGSQVPGPLRAMGIDNSEAGLTRDVMLAQGVDPSLVRLLEAGTSTWEEAGYILQDALVAGHDTITILSNEFHLRRVRRVFRKHFADSGIVLRFHAAPALDHDPARWWQSEQGLLMVNNEYVKLLYYWLKY